MRIKASYILFYCIRYFSLSPHFPVQFYFFRQIPRLLKPFLRRFLLLFSLLLLLLFLSFFSIFPCCHRLQFYCFSVLPVSLLVHLQNLCIKTSYLTMILPSSPFPFLFVFSFDFQFYFHFHFHFYLHDLVHFYLYLYSDFHFRFHFDFEFHFIFIFIFILSFCTLSALQILKRKFSVS